MPIYLIFIILLKNYEKAVHVHLMLLLEGTVLSYYNIKVLSLGFSKIIYSGLNNTFPPTFISEEELIQY